MNDTSSIRERTETPKDSKASRRRGLECAVLIREGGMRPDWTTPLAMFSAILPAPMKPSLYVSLGTGNASIATTSFHLRERERERVALNGSMREARQARLNRDWWVCVCWKRKQCRVVRKKRVFFPFPFFYVGYCSTKLPIGKFVVSNIRFRLSCGYLRFVYTWHDLYLVISYFFLSKKNKKNEKKNTILILKFYQNFVFFNFKLLIFIFKLLKSFLRYAIKNVLFFFLKFKILYIIFFLKGLIFF